MAKGKERRERLPFRRRLRAACDEATCRVWRAELSEGRLTLQGCEDILEYSPCCISFGVRDPRIGRVVLRGQGMICLSYHPDAVVVEGEIHSVVLCPMRGGEGLEVT